MYEFFIKETKSLQDVNLRFFKQESKMWNQIVSHPNYDDSWKPYSVIPSLDLKPIGLKTLVVGGWFDSEDFWGAVKTYSSYAKIDPGNTTLGSFAVIFP